MNGFGAHLFPTPNSSLITLFSIQPKPTPNSSDIGSIIQNLVRHITNPEEKQIFFYYSPPSL